MTISQILPVGRIRTTVLQILREVRDLIKRGWCKKYCACDKDGRVVLINSSAAVKFCIIGAVEKAITGSKINTYTILSLLTKSLPTDAKSLEQFNDNSSHAQVLDLIDKTMNYVQRHNHKRNKQTQKKQRNNNMARLKYEV